MRHLNTQHTQTTKEKALQLNLDSTIYGTVAEIGGGQEVADYFFKAGAASGTIAKSMSAYDMTFSDSIYGKCERYVCEEKLYKMLNREYSLLDQRLTYRAKKTQFFAYANTVETINFKKSNVGHGWMGIRFQKYANTPSNDCIVHVSLKDLDTFWQQQVLGIIGINLIHACCTYNTAEEIIEALADNVNRDRFEIDMFHISGPYFQHVDNRLMTLKLIREGLTQAAMFGPDKKVMLPAAILHKKNTIIIRGRFRPVTYVNVDMMISGIRTFKKVLPKEEAGNILSLTEISIHELLLNGKLDEQDYLDRVDLLCLLGQKVMITNHLEHYKLTNYLSTFIKNKTLAIVLGMDNMDRIFDENYYLNLKGGILEAFGRLFGKNVKLLTYPTLDEKTNQLKKSKNFKPSKHLQSLFNYLVENHNIIDIEEAKTENLHINSSKALEMIQSNTKGWEKMVPNKVVDAIKEQHLFDYPYQDEIFSIKE